MFAKAELDDGISQDFDCGLGKYRRLRCINFDTFMVVLHFDWLFINVVFCPLHLSILSAIYLGAFLNIYFEYIINLLAMLFLWDR